LVSKGIRNLVMFNQALLGKWLWRHGIEREAWWGIAVDSKFGSVWGGWCSLEPVGAFGVGLWKKIRKGWEKFLGLSKFEVGDGARTNFGMICGMRIQFLRKLFLFYLGLLVRRMLLLRIIWNSWVILISRA